MTKNAPQFYVCRQCGHRNSAFPVLKDSGTWKGRGHPAYRLVRQHLHRVICSKCNSREIRIETGERQIFRKKYVATRRSAEEVFHLESCRWMNEVKLSSLREFWSRDTALAEGVRPCNVCKP
jgi:ribosomal protein L40E